MNRLPLSRRQFLSSLPVAGGTVSLLAPTWSGATSGAGLTRISGASVEHMGNTYPLLGYKRLILDYHFSEFNPLTLKKANAQEIAEAMVNLGNQALC